MLESRKKFKPVADPTEKPAVTKKPTTKAPATTAVSVTTKATRQTTTSVRRTTTTTTTTELPSYGDEYPEIPELDDETKACTEGRHFMTHEDDW